MKKKLFAVLLIMTVLSVLASLFVSRSIGQVAFKLENVITIHRIQSLRESLLYHLGKVQNELVTKDTEFGVNADIVADDVAEMSNLMRSCFECHHSPDYAAKLNAANTKMEQFKIALSRAFTIRANTERYRAEADAAFQQGQELLHSLNTLITSAHTKLDKRTNQALAEIAGTKQLLVILVMGIPLGVLLFGLVIINSITRPVDALLQATRKLSDGDFGFRVTGLRDEFGALGESFNSMADSLGQQMKRMQRAEQLATVGQLAAGLAHEIKNPLTGIKAAMEVLKSEPYIHEEDKQVVSMVVSVTNRINFLINELLNYARPKQTQLELIQVNEVLEQLIASVSYSLKQEAKGGEGPGHHFAKELAADLPLIKADPAQLQQVFLNIILNGFEAMPKGGTVTVKSFLVAGTNTLGVIIADTGPGIPEELLEKIFEPFFTNKKKGTGLGLAICKRLVEQHDGSIHVTNSTQGGAAFSVSLPLLTDQGGAR